MTRRLGALVLVLGAIACDDDAAAGAQLEMDGLADHDAGGEVTSGPEDVADAEEPTPGRGIADADEPIEVGDTGPPLPDARDVADLPDLGEDIAPGDPDTPPAPDAGPDVVEPTIGTFEDPAADCLAIASEWPEAPSGTYWLFLQDDVFQAWCDMTRYGGGWTLVSNRPYSPVPGAWGTFFEGEDEEPTPETVNTLPFLDLIAAPTDVLMILPETGDALIQPVLPGAAWQTLSLGARIQLLDGRYLVFGDQVAAVSQAVCFTPGVFDTGFKCDGNQDQLAFSQGLLSAFAEDEICNCSSWSWKTELAGCEVDVCEPEGVISVYLR